MERYRKWQGQDIEETNWFDRERSGAKAKKTDLCRTVYKGPSKWRNNGYTNQYGVQGSQIQQCP
jgi:hypothetical protein